MPGLAAVRRWSDIIYRPAGAKIVFIVWLQIFRTSGAGGWASLGVSLDGRRQMHEDRLVFWFDLPRPGLTGRRFEQAKTPGQETQPATSGLEVPKVHYG